jgi:GNAT superfamily N-acetyltransferase
MLQEHFHIRLAQSSDSLRTNALSDVLGYPSPSKSTQSRLDYILADDKHVILLAISTQDEVVGWIHAFLYHLLVEDLQCYVGGLVVDSAFQQRGAGRSLLKAIEDWAQQNGCIGVRVNSNVIREDARAFYERMGYNLIKQQRAFVKSVVA